MGLHSVVIPFALENQPKAVFGCSTRSLKKMH
jgi:hypothetical protein